MKQFVEDFPQQHAEQRIFVQVASQVGLVVRGEGIFREVQKRVLKWGFDPSRNLRNIPDSAWQGDTFEIDQDNSEHAEAVRLDSPKYWAFRLKERLKDTSRVWTTEVGISERELDEVIFGCRVICSQRGNADPVPRSIPSFVRSIAFTQNAYLDGRRTAAEPWKVGNDEDVEELAAFLQSPQRHHPVVIFSIPEGSSDLDATAVPVRRFIRRTVGFVHSVIITSNAAFALSDCLGKEFSVYRQAVRTYNPGFNTDVDLPTDHPLATAERIMAWEDKDGAGFSDFLINQVLRITRPRDILEKEQPSFQQVKQVAAHCAREAASATGRTDMELLKLAEEELKAVKKEAEDSLDLAVQAEAEREQAISELRQMKASYLALRKRLDNVSSEQSANSLSVKPKSLSDLEIWAQMHLSGQVELHPKAIKAANASDFQNIELVYDALLMMRDMYVPMRRTGGIDLKNKFEQRLAELGLENSRCFMQENKARQYGGDYFIRYQGTVCELDWHLKGSNSRDGRLGFRLYYFWDSEMERVVVGHLPGHLKNDIT